MPHWHDGIRGHSAWPHMSGYSKLKMSSENWLAQIVFNPETGKSKGFGFVKFDDARDAEDAITEANGKVIPSALPQHCLASMNYLQASHASQTHVMRGPPGIVIFFLTSLA